MFSLQNKILDTIKFPCENQTFGCAAIMLPKEKAKHEENCHYRTYRCPILLSDCDWTGTLDQSVKHIGNCHDNVPIVIGCQTVSLVLNLFTIDALAMGCNWGALLYYKEVGYFVTIVADNNIFKMQMSCHLTQSYDELPRVLCRIANNKNRITAN